jgi:carbonic anhydrase
MKKLNHIFENNRAWAERVNKDDPSFFPRLAAQQSPHILWIGCADSRVPATEICGMDPGEIFVHRNVANLVVHTDFNALSVIQYAVEVLKVTDVIVCGHYGCGGVQAALGNKPFGLIDNWLRNIKDTAHKVQGELAKLEGPDKVNRLCEVNVVQQVANLTHSSIIQDAWSRKQDVTIHGLIYSLNDGLLSDLDVSVSNVDELPDIFRVS